MLFPISDDDRGLSGPAIVTWLLILINLVVFFVLQEAGQDVAFTYGWSAIPAEISKGIDLVDVQVIQVEGQAIEIPQAPGPSLIYLTILSAMFMHGGYMHLFGNLLYLWIFGDNVEHRFGRVAFLGFYLLSGVAATMTQVALDPSSVVPTLGASGAISGVLGAYMVLFPRNRVHVIVFYFIVSVPAVVVIGLWIITQFVSGFGSLVISTGSVGGVAYGAHIGGFVAGLVLALIARLIIKEEKSNIFSKYRDGSSP